MTGSVRAASLAMCVLAGLACTGSRDDVAAVIQSQTAVARAARVAAALASRDSSVGGRDAPVAQWVLPHALQEISGLALTSDGRLLAHDDEIGQIWEVDYRRGVVVKRFSLGKGAVTGDFEGMTIAHDVIYMLTSHGRLFEFREGANDTHVAYTVHDTGLQKECEFEGIAFDSAANSLLLACKNVLNKAFHDALVIYRWSLAGDSVSRVSQLAVPLSGVIGANGWKGVHPSDITVDPLTGNYVLVASAENAIISITPAGVVVFARALPAMHHQAEGVAISKDGILIVSDEAGQRPAIITLYRWP
jgi:uncharacterized protein YjiK